ncbi:MAG TPA: outer membrane beta-barrel family protein [Chitinophagaceae bacterium]|nr:outer membrane beta-barrel family protein [Chitinophagaceae bacterium]
MKNVFLIFLVLMSGLTARAQFPMGGGGARTIPSIGHIFGTVEDSLGGTPLPGATVLVLQNKYDTATHSRKDILLKGTTTGGNGEFSLEDLPIIGVLKVEISMVGYRKITLPVTILKFNAATMSRRPPAGQTGQGSFNPDNLPSFDKDLGRIRIGPDANQLKGVTVTANQPLLTLGADKKVFNVEKNLVSVGGTAQDVLKNVPSVLVDADGNVTMRNKTPQIYVDGQPTTLQLNQIPADDIQSIEIITNPSAKYDASGGGGGILNIVLKKQRKQGMNGDLRAGTDKNGGYNLGGDINLRQGKINVSANAMDMHMVSHTTGVTDRNNYFGNPQSVIDQNNTSSTRGGFAFGRIGLDYFATNYTTLSVGAIKVHGQFDPTQSISGEQDSLFSSGTTSTLTQNNTSGSHDFNFAGGQFSLVQLFHKDGEKITANLNYNQGTTSNFTGYATNYYSKSTSALTSVDQEKLMGTGKISFFTFQSDYTLPINNKKSKLEAGIRAASNSNTNNSSNFLMDSLGQYQQIPATIDDYKSTSSVYAAYVDFSSTIRKFSYEAGLRAESSSYNGQLTNTGQLFSNHYPVSLFPSVFLGQELSGNQQLQLSYSRRVNRPNFFQLMPYTDYSDNLNISRGNPGLLPEFTNSFEFSYSKTFKGGNNILASLYWKNTNHLITRFLETALDPINNQEVLINTFINANSSNSYGTEITLQLFPAKWWDASLNVNIYSSDINTGTQDSIGYNNNQVSGFAKLNNNFKFPAGFSLQLSGVYQSRTNLPVSTQTGPGGGGPGMQAQSASQGYLQANWETDLALQKTFLKDKSLTATLSFNDIFRTRKFDQYSFSSLFSQDYTRLTDPQMIRLNVSYRFGKYDFTLFKRKDLKSQGEGMQNANQMMSY